MDDKIINLREYAKHKSADEVREDLLNFITHAREMLKILNAEDGQELKDDIDKLRDDYAELFRCAHLMWYHANQGRIHPPVLEKLRQILIKLDGKARPTKPPK